MHLGPVPFGVGSLWRHYAVEMARIITCFIAESNADLSFITYQTLSWVLRLRTNNTITRQADTLKHVFEWEDDDSQTYIADSWDEDIIYIYNIYIYKYIFAKLRPWKVERSNTNTIRTESIEYDISKINTHLKASVSIAVLDLSFIGDNRSSIVI